MDQQQQNQQGEGFSAAALAQLAAMFAPFNDRLTALEQRGDG
jgi:hypothetical protein